MNTINYETQTNILRPITLPVEDRLNSEEEVQTKEERLNNTISLQEKSQEQKDQQRQVLVASVGRQSKQTQAEIYLAVALEQDVNLQRDNQYMLESLQRTQDQNNAVKAYAAYQEAGQAIQPRF